MRRRNRRDALVVRVVDDVHETTRLRRKGADLAVVPPADDCLAVRCEAHGVALKIGHSDAEELSAVARVPHANVVDGARGKALRVAIGERDIVDHVVVARGLEGGSKRRVRDLIDVRLRRPGKKVRATGARRRDGRHGAVKLRRRSKLEAAGLDDGDSAIASTDDNVAAGNHGEAEDAHAQLLLLRPRVLEEARAKVDLQHIAARRAAVKVFVVVRHDNAAHDTLQLAQLAVCRADLTVREVQLPHAKRVAAASNEHVVVVVRVCHSKRRTAALLRSGRAADGVAVREVPHDDRVVVLAAERDEVLVIGRECERLHLNLVQRELVLELAGRKVPHNNLRLETHVCDLPRSNEAPALRHGDARDCVGVALEKILLVAIANLPCTLR
eukprot:Opistho-1_new@44305